MTERPRKGHPVAFQPDTGAAAPATVDPVTGLRFSIGTQDGREVLVDYVHLRPRWLSLAFARALRRLAGPGGPLTVRSTVMAYVCTLPKFFTYLADTRDRLDAPEHLDSRHIDGFEAWSEANGKSRTNLFTQLIKVVAALREVAAEGAVQLSAGLRDRLAYASARPTPPSCPRDAYSPYIARQLRDAARRDLMAVIQRFRAPRPAEHDVDLDIVEAAAHAVILSKGMLHNKAPEYRALYLARRGRKQSTKNLNNRLHEQHYLTSQDIVPFLVFLALETGLEIECCKTLTVDCLQNPSNGTVEIAYVKRRVHGAEHKRLRVRDGGAGTPGGLIRHVIAMTEAARRHCPSENLWVYYGLGRLISGIRHPQWRIDAWTRHLNLIDDEGRALHLELCRLRKTHKALWYLKTDGHMARFAVGHTREVAARHYADVPALRPLHEAAVAEALTEVVTSALAPIVLTPEQENAWRSDPASASGVPAGSDPIALLEGEQDVWLASCGGFFSSPHGESGSPCPVPFWGCLECSNAVITTRKLPAILSFLDFIEDQRKALSAGNWMIKFGRAYSRITNQILPAFAPAALLEAREALAQEPALIYLPPEARL
ncbi:MAG: hypothetical protein WB611_14205 [Stellaceae bacterium]